MADPIQGTPLEPINRSELSGERILTPSGNTHRLKRAFDEFHRKHATWMVYIRADRKFVCRVCSASGRDPGEGKADCPNCLGTGYNTTRERMPVIVSKYRIASRPDPDVAPGLLIDGKVRAYFKTENPPSQFDILLEVEWDREQRLIGATGEPVSVVHIYRLDAVESSNDGQILFFSAALDLQDHRRPSVERALFAHR